MNNKISKSNYDFNKVKGIIVDVVEKLNANEYYNSEDLKDRELSKASYELIKLIEDEDGFKDVFDYTQTVVLTNSEYNLDDYDIVKNSILNTLNNGVDDTITKLNKLFDNDETCYSYYTLLGIKIDKEYQINDYIKLIPINSTNSTNQSNSDLDFSTRYKDMFIKNAFSASAALVLKDNIKIERHEFDKLINFELKKYLEIELISLLISLQTNTGCIMFENYSKFNNDCILSQPTITALHGCEFFPNEAVDVSIDIKELNLLLLNIEEFSGKYFEHIKRILNMFAHACIKKNYMDSCLELRAILEGIFAMEGKEDISYTHLVSERGALFLEKNIEKRKEIFKELKEQYNITSKVIHNTYTYKNGDEEKIIKLKNYCNKSIIQIINNKKFYTTNDWNDLIFE